MELIKLDQKRTIVASDTTTIHEYDTQDGFVSGAVAEIKGRYPAQGFVVNKKIKELVYVLSGKGQIILSQEEIEISAGDVVFVDHMEKFAWNGNMILFMATTPSFDPQQHIEVE
jgi:mannose-6-phosphate isomerase-like protein (cupin superfamily)